EDQGKDTPEGSVYIQTFLKKSPWQPERIAVFAGALYYPRYRWFDKMMIRLIMTLTGGETDTSKEVEYTNWEKVSQFGEQFRNW
ncbi:menaquinone-dependent protoporphyrinogen IX dehydrogenase, partial [Vibrio cholerae]